MGDDTEENEAGVGTYVVKRKETRYNTSGKGQGGKSRHERGCGLYYPRAVLLSCFPDVQETPCLPDVFPCLEVSNAPVPAVLFFPACLPTPSIP